MIPEKNAIPKEAIALIRSMYIIAFFLLPLVLEFRIYLFPKSKSNYQILIVINRYDSLYFNTSTDLKLNTEPDLPLHKVNFLLTNINNSIKIKIAKLLTLVICSFYITESILTFIFINALDKQKIKLENN